MEESIGHQQLPYLIIGGSVTGPSHLKTGIPCQDASGFQIYSSEMAVMCVADGAGSAKYADIGAQTAVAAVLKAFPSEKLIDLIDEAVIRNSLREVFLAARHAVEEQSAVQKCLLRDLASTLIVAILHNDSVAVGHLGDGAVVVEDSNGLTVLSPPEESEYTNETMFLTAEMWEQFIRIRRYDSGVNSMAVFSDGCQRASLLHKQEGWIASPGFLGTLFTYAREIDNDKEGALEIQQLLESEKVCEHSDDDKSLLIAVNKFKRSRE